MFKSAIVTSLLLAIFASSASAASRQAEIVAVQGSPTVKTSSSAASQTAVKGLKLSESGSINTLAGGEVTIKFFDGTVTVVQAKSDLTIAALNDDPVAGKPAEKTLLNLRSGSLVATLDPGKKDTTDYKVQTPKGVAAARGTVFSVTINVTGGTTAATLQGTITFTPLGGGAPITVSLGNATTGGGVLTVAQAIAANPGFAADLAAAAVSVATAVGQGGITSNVNTVLAAVTSMAVQANPNQAAQIAAQVVTLASPGITAAGGNSSTSAAIVADAAKAGLAKSDSPTANTGTQIDTAVFGATPPGGTGKTDSQPTILPPLDQTQITVSPSRP